jgi:membrane-bound lytic murein transglycosylase B
VALHARRRNGKVRKGISGSAAAVLAMAALTASQGPEFVSAGPAAAPPEPARSPSAGAGAGQRAPESTPEAEPEDQAPSLPYHTDLPPLDTSEPRLVRAEMEPAAGRDAESGGGQGAENAQPVVASESGIPATVLDAYRRAETVLAGITPGCGLDWEVLAAIGKVESGHAAGGAVDADGTTYEPILGPELNGDGFAEISDTDGGRWDADMVYDRAVGPMQFIPSTWASWAADGNGDGLADPNNVYDATLAAGNYLCAGGRDLSEPDGIDSGLLSYNHSWDYVRTVRAWLDYYLQGTHEVPDGEGQLPASPGAGNPGGESEPAREPSPEPPPAQAADEGRPDPSPSQPDESEEPSEPARPAEPEEPGPSPSPGEPDDPTPSPTQPGDPADPDEPSPSDPGDSDGSDGSEDPEEPDPTPSLDLTDLTDPLGLTGLTDALGLTNSAG